MKTSISIFAGILAAGLLASAAHGQVIAGPVATYTPTVSTLTTGTVLDATAAVSSDDRYVTLRLNLSQSSLDGIDSFGVGGGGVGGGGFGTGFGANTGFGTGTVFGAPAGGVGALSQQFIISPQGRAVGVADLPYRPAVVGEITLVEQDNNLESRAVPAISLMDMSLRIAVRKLADASGSNIAVGWKALADAHIDDNAPHRVEIERGTLKDALITLVNHAAAEKPMVITFEDNVAYITTQAQADTMVVRRWYYTADLLANAARWMPSNTDLGKIAKPQHVTVRVVMTTPPPLPSLFAPGTYPVTPPPQIPRLVAVKPSPNAPATDVEALITSTVRPEIWKCNGGKYSEVKEVGDRVWVTAPESVQALLDGPKHYNPNAVPMYLNMQQ